MARWAAAVAPPAVSYVVMRRFCAFMSSRAIVVALARAVPTAASGPVIGTSSATRWRASSCGSAAVGSGAGGGVWTGGGAFCGITAQPASNVAASVSAQPPRCRGAIAKAPRGRGAIAKAPRVRAVRPVVAWLFRSVIASPS